MAAIMPCKSWMQFIVYGLYIKEYKVCNIKQTSCSIVEDNTAGIQCCVYAFLLAETEVFLHEGSLHEGFATSAGYTAGLYEITIL